MTKTFVFLSILCCANFAYGDGLYITQNTSCNFSTNPKNLRARFRANQHTCSAGYYMPANYDGCAPCPSGHTCAGGTFTFNKTKNQGIVYRIPIITTVSHGCTEDLLVPVNGTASLHAKFTPNTISINWAGASGTFTTTNCTYDGEIATPTNTPTKRGHIFNGWKFITQ